MWRLGIALVCLLSVATLSVHSVMAGAADPGEVFNRYLSDIRNNPDDNAVREKIIRFAQTMKPAPPIPEEARRNFVMAKTIYSDARSLQDYGDAVAKFKTALLLAPWWGDAYLDMGLACKGARQYEEAGKALKLYMAAYPGGEKNRKAQDEIYIVEAKQEEAVKASKAVAGAKVSTNAYKKWLRSLEGARFIGPPQDNYNGGTAYIVYYIEDAKVHLGWFDLEPVDFKTSAIRPVEFADKSWSVDIQGKQFLVPQPKFMGAGGAVVTISDDGQFITFERDKTVYRRVR